jgi:hypothetical protein
MYPEKPERLTVHAIPDVGEIDLSVPLRPSKKFAI